jgi:hypothetical protein
MGSHLHFATYRFLRLFLGESFNRETSRSSRSTCFSRSDASSCRVWRNSWATNFSASSWSRRRSSKRRIRSRCSSNSRAMPKNASNQSAMVFHIALRPSKDGFDGGQDVGRFLATAVMTHPLIGEPLKDSIGFGQIMLRLRLITGLALRCCHSCSLAHEAKTNQCWGALQTQIPAPENE